MSVKKVPVQHQTNARSRPIKKSIENSKAYPVTELVILAGGQAQRMNGINKLLQVFDQERQLLKIYKYFKSEVAQVWVNSHRDHSIYQHLVSHIRCYTDDIAGFRGPLMGMKSAWSHVCSDYVLFVPCDVTYIAEEVLLKLHQTLATDPLAQVAYVEMNATALYPFCLLKRSSLPVLSQYLEHPDHKQRSLKHCFQALAAQVLKIQHHALQFHSINSWDELHQYRLLNSIA